MSFFTSLFNQPFFKNIQPDFTYIGIGSCPHAHTPAEFTPKQNQLIPAFVRDQFEAHQEDPSWTLRILHFDPFFSQKLPFLLEYFEQEGLIYSEEGDVYCWFAPNLQIIVVPEKILEQDDPYGQKKANAEGIEAIVRECVDRRSHLVLQSFTGSNTVEWFRSLYERSHDRYSFRDNILFDITYENAIGCSTDMTHYKPLYDARGKFINLLLYTKAELLNILEITPQYEDIRRRARRIYFAEFRSLLNTKHVEYRRIVQQMSTSSKTAEEMMAELQQDLDILLPVLIRLGLFHRSQRKELETLFHTYKEHDMYKWYNAVIQMVKLEEADEQSQPQPQ